MKLHNPFKNLTRFEWVLWIVSVAVLLVTFIAGGESDPMIIAATLVGVTGLVFIARGDVWGHMCTIIFSIMHMSPMMFLNVTIAGFIYGWLFWRTKSLVPGIIAHITCNTIVSLCGPVIEYFTNPIQEESSLYPCSFSLCNELIRWCQRVSISKESNKCRTF